MISFDLGNQRFQVRAAAVFVWRGSVLLHRPVSDAFWALPGGRLEPGEDAASAVLREMREELDEDVCCGPLACVGENFFDSRGQSNHEIGFYFHASFGDGSSLLDVMKSHVRTEGEQSFEFKWFPLTGLDQIDVRPAFLRQFLARPAMAFEHIVQRT